MCMWESRGAGFPQEKIYISRSSSLENNIQDAYVRALQICPTGVGLAFFLGESEQNPKVVFQGMELPTHQQPSPNWSNCSWLSLCSGNEMEIVLHYFCILSILLSQNQNGALDVGGCERPSEPSIVSNSTPKQNS